MGLFKSVWLPGCEFDAGGPQVSELVMFSGCGLEEFICPVYIARGDPQGSVSTGLSPFGLCTGIRMSVSVELSGCGFRAAMCPVYRFEGPQGSGSARLSPLGLWAGMRVLGSVELSGCVFRMAMFPVSSVVDPQGSGSVAFLVFGVGMCPTHIVVGATQGSGSVALSGCGTVEMMRLVDPQGSSSLELPVHELLVNSTVPIRKSHPHLFKFT